MAVDGPSVARQLITSPHIPTSQRAADSARRSGVSWVPLAVTPMPFPSSGGTSIDGVTGKARLYSGRIAGPH